jgi:hypothetical protein
MRKETQKLLVLSLLGLISVNLTAQQKAKKDTIKGIEEVVVTALGIKRDDRSLGYSTQTVKSEESYGLRTITGHRLWKVK